MFKQKQKVLKYSRRLLGALKYGFLGILLVGALFSNAQVFSADGAGSNVDAGNDACRSYLSSHDIGVADLFLIGKFLPVVPNECSTYNGQKLPLKLDIIPNILVRVYGFLAAVVVYLFSFMMVVYGLQWMFGGLEGDHGVKVKKNFKNAVAALIIALTISTIIIELLELIGYDTNDLSKFENIE